MRGLFVVGGDCMYGGYGTDKRGWIKEETQERRKDGRWKKGRYMLVWDARTGTVTAGHWVVVGMCAQVLVHAAGAARVQKSLHPLLVCQCPHAHWGGAQACCD